MKFVYIALIAGVNCIELKKTHHAHHHHHHDQNLQIDFIDGATDHEVNTFAK